MLSPVPLYRIFLLRKLEFSLKLVYFAAGVLPERPSISSQF